MTSQARTVRLNNGQEMPLLGLGTWQSKPGQVTAAVSHALKSGYRHIDGAALYGNEVEVGAGIKESGVRREDIFVTSKLWNTKHHPEDVEKACRKSLEDLGLEYLDLYLIHWPTAFERGDVVFPKNEDGSTRYDTEIHPTTTWLAMEKLVEKGLVRSIGVSNFNSEQIQDILEKGGIVPVTNQVESHPYLSQAKLLEFCSARKIVVTAYSPLGSPDRPWASPEDPKLLDDPKIVAMAEKQGKSPAQVVIRWQVQRGVAVIPKSVTPSRIEENGDIFSFSLPAEDMAHLASLECNGRLILPDTQGHPHFPFHAEY